MNSLDLLSDPRYKQLQREYEISIWKKVAILFALTIFSLGIILGFGCLVRNAGLVPDYRAVHAQPQGLNHGN